MNRPVVCSAIVFLPVNAEWKGKRDGSEIGMTVRPVYYPVSN